MTTRGDFFGSKHHMPLVVGREALQGKVTYTTTITGAWAMCEAMAFSDGLQVYRLQDLHKGIEETEVSL